MHTKRGFSLEAPLQSAHVVQSCLVSKDDLQLHEHQNDGAIDQLDVHACSAHVGRVLVEEGLRQEGFDEQTDAPIDILQDLGPHQRDFEPKVLAIGPLKGHRSE